MSSNQGKFNRIIKEGYRPTDKMDTSNLPPEGSAVASVFYKTPKSSQKSVEIQQENKK